MRLVNGYEIGPRADLSRANLREADLPGADLRWASLREADLPGANLSGADLSRANLSGANLSGAYLREADLRWADLRWASLREADLPGANLRGAHLSRANLSGAYLSGADLSRANLSGANLSGAYLNGANLSGASLSGANLSGAYLNGAYLLGVNHDLHTRWPHFQIPQEGELIVYKKLFEGVICKLRIPPEAKRTASVVGRKCRAEYAEVLEGEGYSAHNRKIFYSPRIGVVRPDKYDSNFLVVCAPGIHFFLTREEAEEY